MQPVITPEESAQLEIGHDVARLMERAGLAVALEAVAMGIGYGSRVSILCGPGNNGGDGLVAARLLQQRGVAVTAHLLGQPKTKMNAAALAAARSAGVWIGTIEEWAPADVVIDALFGGGFKGNLPSSLDAWMYAPRVLSVDVPSGLNPSTGEPGAGGFTAERTVTFHALKTGHVFGSGPDRSGAVSVIDLGLSPSNPALRVAEAVDAGRPTRPRTAHKWSVGAVVAIGGGSGMVGASILAARSALMFGAGAAAVAVRDVALAQAAAPELLAYAFDSIPLRYGVAVIGPGLGPGAGDLVERHIADDERALVVDADGLAGLTVAALKARTGPTVLTPHAQEFRRLVGEEPSPANAMAYAASTGTTILLKGNPTFVTDGGPPWVVRSGGPELATIGTGDVLAGMIGALLGRGLDPEAAAMSAAFWHGVAAADLARSGTVTADLLVRHIRGFAWE